MIGINIDGIDTLSTYGLILCDDLEIGTPEAIAKFVEIPGADGALDLTETLTGGINYGMREISFSLFAARDVIAGTQTPATETNFAEIRRRFAVAYLGKLVQLQTPDDTSRYYKGRLQMDAKSGFNSGTIPIIVQCQPWHYKNSVTTRRVSVSASDVLFTNEMMKTVPTFTVTTGGARVIHKGVTYNLQAGENTFEGIVFGPGENRVSFASVSDPITVSWQEASI